MAISRGERMAERTPRVEAVFGRRAAIVLELLGLVEVAWHDVYGEVTPPEDVVDDILVCSEGDLETLIRAAVLAITDARDLRVWSDRLREA